MTEKVKIIQFTIDGKRCDCGVINGPTATSCEDCGAELPAESQPLDISMPMVVNDPPDPRRQRPAGPERRHGGEEAGRRKQTPK